MRSPLFNAKRAQHFLSLRVWATRLIGDGGAFDDLSNSEANTLTSLMKLNFEQPAALLMKIVRKLAKA
ncbi:MAG: hypothetical protein ACTS6G_04265 [Candidatus Hodgkinia cicadicola]